MMAVEGSSRGSVTIARGRFEFTFLADCFYLGCLTRLYLSLGHKWGMARGCQRVPERVVEAVADYTNSDVLDLPPLFDSIDSEALDTVVRSMNDGTVSFVYAGLWITVDSQGAVRIEEHPPPVDAEQ
jgi:hypothetical protein